jgi:hypothetical protein
MLAAERDQRPRQQGPHGAGERADADRPGQPGPRGGEPGVGRLQRGQDQLGVRHQRRAGGGQADPPARPLQQRHAGVPLQRSELLGNGRRRVGTGPGDGGDRSEPGEIPQQFEAAHVKH